VGPTVIGRILVAPALVCLLLGAGLGVWGWTQRDASRARMVEEADAAAEADLADVYVDGGPVFDPRAWACQNLLSAGALETPSSTGAYGYPLAPATGDTVTSVEVPPAQIASELITMLGPEQVTGIVGLDVPEVQAAMAEMRAAVIEASSTGVDVRIDPTVNDAAVALLDVVVPIC